MLYLSAVPPLRLTGLAAGAMPEAVGSVVEAAAPNPNPNPNPGPLYHQPI